LAVKILLKLIFRSQANFADGGEQLMRTQIKFGMSKSTSSRDKK